MTTPTKKQIALFALDIETDGPSAEENNILSIGTCLGDLDGNVIMCRRFDMKPVSGRRSEEATMTGFLGSTCGHTCDDHRKRDECGKCFVRFHYCIGSCGYVLRSADFVRQFVV